MIGNEQLANENLPNLPQHQRLAVAESQFGKTRMSEPPADMLPELSEWNNGAGIDLRSWIQASGNFRLAIGYSTVFWPRFKLCGDYIVREEVTAEGVQAWEEGRGNDKRGIEATMNHLHIADLHYGSEDITRERILFLADVLKEAYSAKLAWQFPDRPCVVELFEPGDKNDLVGYQITFWQKKHAELAASPNDGPPAPSGNSGATQGPPSVNCHVRR